MSNPPPCAVLVWADHRAVWLEVPVTSGGHSRISFPLTEGGLSKALNFLRLKEKISPRPHTPAKISQPITHLQQSALEKIIANLEKKI